MIDPRDHPEHDLLAALPQHSLTKSERSAVLSHLAECSECRHSVMFLAEVEESRGPEPRQPGWSPLALWAAAAAVALLTFTSLHSTAFRPETQSAAVSTAYPAVWRARSFQHVRLTRSAKSERTDALTIHLAGFKPSENQVVVRSQYGDRWLTFDSFLSLATNDGPVSTVN